MCKVLQPVQGCMWENKACQEPLSFGEKNIPGLTGYRNSFKLKGVCPVYMRMKIKASFETLSGKYDAVDLDKL